MKVFRAMFSVMLLASFFCSTVTIANSSITDDYPDLEPLTLLVSGEDISPMHLLAYRAVKVAMQKLGFQHGDSNILVLTDAGNPIIADKYPTACCLDALTLISGCSKSKGNLVVVQRSKWLPLWFAFYSRDTGMCVYVQANSAILASYMDAWEETEDKLSIQQAFMNLPDEEVFEKIAVENISAELLLSKPEAWHEKMENKVFGGNEFSIITIAACWDKGLPYELLKAAELHNHICPGLTSGVLIIKYLDQHLPIEEVGQEYVILAVPPWCKDDAFQAVYDSTVGKRKMTVMMLSKQQIKQLPEEAKNVAGIYVKWDKSEGKGYALVLAFDWDKACNISGIERAWFKDFKSYKWWYARLKMGLILQDYIDSPEEFVTTVMEFPINSSSELTSLRLAGVNPYVELGLMPAPQPEVKTITVEVVPAWAYAAIAILALALIAMIAAYAKRKAQ
ncbi:MAG: hypothetical protein DRJ31_06560 [Candidatus Methanomethylicota archaeon]|uniref:Formylmethanofuran dehydrogenase subunit E domain-containing protein n=1 Tax=Thermoproteota archaeon TaxID=2056631 RepID=A0A497EN36_9CREN|nr:MAG: hypothetical protein DRJ31_06560 [Candidatus Verstraetearchaeota archaeon]